jgi:hypothetical protein
MQLIADSHGRISAEAALRFLADEQDIARANRNGKSHHCICNQDTIQSVLFVPDEGRLLVSHGCPPAPKGRYVEVTDAHLWDMATHGKARQNATSM